MALVSSPLTMPPPPRTSPLHSILDLMLGKCPSSYKALMKHKLQSIRSFILDTCGNGLTLTTACSGTDLVCETVSIFLRHVLAEFSDPAVEVEHLWSCESVHWKARWIREVMKTETIFCDISELPTGLACVHGRTVRAWMTSGLVHATAFSCKSVSVMNSWRKHFRNCIADRSGTTGSTAWATIRFARQTLPLFLWLENVAGFSGKSLRKLLRMLRAMGYVVVVLLLDNELCAVPQRRRRRWLICKLEPSISQLDDAVQEGQLRADNLWDSLKQSERLPLSRFLLPDDHLPAQAQKTRRGFKRKQSFRQMFSQRKKPKSAPKWPALHGQMWNRIPESKALEVDSEDFEQSFLASLDSSIGALPEREQDIMLYDRIMNADSYLPFTDEERILDISQSITRYPIGTNCVPCITPAAK